jgi:hypothetical protein
MKKLNYLILLAYLVAIAFQACKTSEKSINADKEKITNNAISKKDAILLKDYITVVSAKNVIDTNSVVKKNDRSNEKKIEFKEFRDSTIPYIDIKDLHAEFPLGHPITTQLPQIFTKLFPDVSWELIYVNDGHEKMYRASYKGNFYGYSIINNLIYSFYKSGELEEREIIEFFIFWIFHPIDNLMKIISIDECFGCYGTANYYVNAMINNENIDIYLLVKDKRIVDFGAFKNGKLIKTEFISY